MGWIWLLLHSFALLPSSTCFTDGDIFAVLPKSQDVYAGRNAVFQCSLRKDYKDLYSLEWLCGGMVMRYDSRRFVGSDGYLHFDPVDKDKDSGEFQCVATANRPPYEKQYTGNVSLNIKWLIVYSVTLQLPSGETDALPGTRNVLKCNTTGSPKPQTKNIQWYLNGTDVNEYRLKFNTSKGRLVIETTELRKYDGSYSCCLPEDNQKKCSIQPYVLHVRDKSMPVVTNFPKDVIVQRGSDATFSCGFDSFPPAEIEWTRDDGFVIKQKQTRDCRLCSFGNGTLIVRNVKERYEGTYICKGSVLNGGTVSASAKLTIARIKNFSNPIAELKYLELGQDLEKVCNPPVAEPPPTIVWIRQGQRILPSSGGMTTRVTVSGKTLVIQSVQLTDEGEYQCIARNIAGNATKTYKFAIKQMPKIVSGLVARTEREGSEVVLICLAEGSPPPTFVWHQNSTILKHDSHFIVQENQLTIEKILVKDAAEYKCIAQNDEGSVASSAYIGVKEWLKFDTMPSELCVEANKSTEVPCIAKGVKDSVVGWTVSHDANETKSSEKIKIISYGPANKSLILVNPELGEHWTAYCTANTEGTLVDLSPATHTVRISVGKRPKIVKPPQNSVVFKGQSVKLYCGIDPHPNNFELLRWRIVTNKTRAEYTVKTNSDNANYNIMNDGSFFIKAASTADSGNYSCHYKDCGFEVGEQAVLDVAETEWPITTPPDSDDENQGKEGPQYKKIQTVALAAGCSVAYLILTLTIIIYCRRKKRHKNKSSSAKSHGNAEGSPLMQDGFSNAGNGVSGGDQVMLRPVCLAIDEMRHLQYDHSRLDHVTVIGRGEFGDIYLSRAPGIFPDLQDDVLVMVKNFDTDSYDQSSITGRSQACRKALRLEFNREFELLHMADHKNIGRILGVCVTAKDGVANVDCFITEYLEWGILKLCLQASSDGKLRRFSKMEKMKMCYQIAAALEHLTKIHLCHQDVATRNCLISSKLFVKLSVLSLKKEGFENEYALHRGRLLPVRWMAPEALVDGSFVPKSDVWSFGVTCWEIFTLGTLPFSDLSDDQFLEEIESEHPPTLPTLDASKRIASLISKCCQVNQALRPEFYQIVKKLHSISGVEPSVHSKQRKRTGAEVHVADGLLQAREEGIDIEVIS